MRVALHLIAAALWPCVLLVVVEVVASRGPSGVDGVNVDAARSVFSLRCASCHSLDRDDAARIGPNLFAIGTDGATRKDGLSAPEYVLESILDPEAVIAPGWQRGMPRRLTSGLEKDVVRGLVALLCSQSAEIDMAEIAALDVPDPGPEEEPIAIGRARAEMALEALEGKGKCLQCHSLYNAAHSRLAAPSLFHAGLADPEQLRESITEPSKVVAPAYRASNVFLREGSVEAIRYVDRTDDVLEGYKVENQRLVPVEIPMSKIQKDATGEPLVRASQVSPMPEGYDTILSPEEIDAIVDLIRSLR